MGNQYRVGETVYRVLPVYRQNEIAIDMDGVVHSAVLEATGPGEYCLRTQGRARRVLMHRERDRVLIHLDGYELEVCCENRLVQLQQQALAAHAGGEVTAPMPGVVVDVRVEVGQPVSSGDPVIAIESMKLQTELTATHTGIVSEVQYAEGDSFEQGAVLVRIEPPEQDAHE